MAVTLDTPLIDYPGIGAARQEKLERLGLSTTADLLAHYPRCYEDRRRVWTIQDAPLGDKVCVCALVADSPRLSRIRKGLELVQVRVVDETGALHLTFFNQAFVQHALQPGQEYIFYGTLEGQGRRRTMTNPIFERAGQQALTGCIVPVYPLTAGISNHQMCALTRRALGCAGAVPETLPRQVLQEHQLAQMEFSLRAIHYPESFEALELARRRLTFEELFYLSVGLARLKGRRADTGGRPLPGRGVEEFLPLLPFPPTSAQRRVMEEIRADLTASRPMNRLVQGDVGSGKTAVAAFAAWLTVQGGCQCAMMAPTEVLAEQHYRSLSALLGGSGVRVGLLTGSLSAGEKKRVRAAAAAGELDLLVGTHALLSQEVAFQSLALVITDEQHRFGVAQRSALAEKSRREGETIAPHVLVMSATPIPRTLALIIYGDLDVSVIDELPPGRTPVSTYLIGEDKRARMYAFVEKLVGEGRQVYIICPAVEDNPEDEGASALKAVKSYAQTLSTQVFPHLRLGLIHGRLRPREKEAVMSAFHAGALDILVSTTVIEVGVDVPNAALMVIENAERFGLSQLHQLRGRVGRGKHASYCVLMTASRQPDSLSRLRTLASTTDGFRIAEEDLKLRGPGDFFGSRQHGLPQLALADLTGDMRLLQEAQQAAQALLARDPELTLPENRPVLERVRKLFADTPDIFN